MSKILKKIMILGGTILGTFIVSLIVFGVVTIFSNLSSANNMQLCYGDLHYVLAENDEYISYQERNRVIIKDRNGGQVVSFDPQKKEIWPDQMVLGKEHFYMLEWDDTTTETFRDAIIMQFDYNANVKKRIKVQKASCIACKDGYLFLGKIEKTLETEPNYLKGFWAQYYIEEEKFGDKWNIIENQSYKKTKIGNTSLYYHDAGYFSTEPDLNGYCGTVLEDFSVKDREKYLISIENKRAKENLQLLLKKVNWGNADRCQWQEYQKGTNIYGICNLYNSNTELEKLPIDEVKQAVFYRIDCVDNTIKILKQCNDTCAVLCTEKYILYETENALIKYDVISGKSKNVLSIEKPMEQMIYVDDDFLEITNINPEYVLRLDETDCEILEEINNKPINQDCSRLNTIDTGVYFYDTTWITNYSQVEGIHYYWLRYDANEGKYIIYQDNRVKIGKFELPYQFEDDIPYFLDGFTKYGSDFYAIISSMDTEKDDDDNQIQQLAKVNLKKENLEIIYDVSNEHIAGDGEKLFCCIYKDYFYLDSRTKWQSYDKRAGKPVRIDIKGKTMEKLSTTTNMKKASPYLSYINDKIFYAVNEGEKTSLFSYDLKEKKEQCFLKLPAGENNKTEFVRFDKDFIYYGKYIISRKDKKTFHVLKSGDKNVISNEKYVFYLDKTNKIHRLDKQNKHDIIIRKKPATEISCTEKKLFARVRNKKAYTKCVRDAADADEFADSGEDFYSDNLYCLDLRGREENKIWKGSYKWTN